MALKGHGDPRWIVEDRADGKNVNNWHWTETDYTSWAKNKLTELLVNLPIETNEITCKTTSLTCTGDVSVNTRKQKTILFYELVVKISWEGTYNKSGLNTKGTIHLPYISEENDDDDFEINLTVEGDTSDHEQLKDLLRKEVIPVLKQKIPLMLKELRDVAIGQTKLPPKQEPANKLDKLETTVAVKQTPTSNAPSKPSGPRLVSVSVTDKFMCRPMDLYFCFVEPNRVKAYAGGDATVDAKVGGKFALFGGAVVGEFTELVPGSKLVQKWRFSSWSEGHYSTVVMDFEEKNGKTVFKLTQTNIPEQDKERTEGGWRDNFLRRIKGVFGYGGLS